MTVRTRIAPSPTGDPHVGTAYIALFNYCFTRAHGGQFVLRIEDTDQARSSLESEQNIMEALRWLGLGWDEGPDVGGPHGPYRQSERREIYARYAQQLIDQGDAFYCFCTPERLAQARKEQEASGARTTKYDGLCLGVSPEEARARVAAGEPHVIRMKVPTEGDCVMQDRLRGEITKPWDDIDMQVLVKSDGMPTYHLAAVVDDHEMGITHIIRGEEWLNSVPKHLELYRMFGWEPPELIHLPLLRNPDKSKLSKRKNPTSITHYERMGFLPEALLNYLGRMGWSILDEVEEDGETKTITREKYTVADMIEHFDIDRISLGGPVFDVEKLKWLNGLYLREMDREELGDRYAAWGLSRERLMPVLDLVHERIETLAEVAPLAGHFLIGVPDLDAAAFEHPKVSADDMKKSLFFASVRLETVRPWDRDGIDACLRETADLLEMKLRDFLAPFFLMMAGSKISTPLFESLALLGRDVVRARIRNAIDALGGVSGKQDKKWRKALR